MDWKPEWDLCAHFECVSQSWVALPSPQAGCAFRTCPHTANTAPLLGKQPHKHSRPATFLQAAPHPKPQSSGFQQSHFTFPLSFCFPGTVPDWHLPSPPGALYSRKFTIDGEQISLQVQDTPFVSLEVKQLLCAVQHTSVLCLLPALPSVINSA